MNNYDIEDLLDIDVDNILWLRILNGQSPLLDLFNKSNIQRFMQDLNERYCEDRNLCLVCRSELVEVKENRGEHFGIPVSENILICPNGC